MKQILKLLPVLFVTASCLTSDTTLSSKPEASPMVSWFLDEPSGKAERKVQGSKTLSQNSVTSVSTTLKPRYLAFPNWGTTACIRRKE